jgi:hypothetical protein
MGVDDMKSINRRDRILAAGGSALIGALVGVMLAALGALVSSSDTAVVATVLFATGLGAYAGRIPGALSGLAAASLAVAFGSLIGGSALGFGLTVLACAAVAAYSQWCSDQSDDWPPHEAARVAQSMNLPRSTNDEPDVVDSRPRPARLTDAGIDVRLCSRV